jgi:SET domain-containing protein
MMSNTLKIYSNVTSRKKQVLRNWRRRRRNLIRKWMMRMTRMMVMSKNWLS